MVLAISVKTGIGSLNIIKRNKGDNIYMKSYIVKGTFNTIYDGDIFKVVNEAGQVEFNADLKQYHVFDEISQNWETWPIDNVHKNIYLSKQMYRGKVQEFPSYETAQRACDKNLKK